MSEEELPNFLEAELTEIWRYRQEHKGEEDWAKERRKHADQAILKRAAEMGATVLSTEWGNIKITLPQTYQYNIKAVDEELLPLVERDGLAGEWNQFVRHTYKINRNWLNELAKRGEEYQAVIDQITDAATGSPSIKGPELPEEEYAQATEEAIF